MIIAVNGKIGSGKDTVGKIIQYLTQHHDKINGLTFEEWDKKYSLDNGYTWQIKKFAEKLKIIASFLTGIPVNKWEDQEFKKEYMGDEWGMTYREFLQYLGTDAMRNGLHSNVWVNSLFADYKPPKMSEYHPSNWIITDLRFPNELEAVKQRNGITIKIEKACKYCKGTGYHKMSCDSILIPQHISETALDHITDWDYILKNNGTIKDLIEKIKIILKDKNII